MRSQIYGMKGTDSGTHPDMSICFRVITVGWARTIFLRLYPMLDVFYDFVKLAISLSEFMKMPGANFAERWRYAHRLSAGYIELGYASRINQKEWPGVISVSIPPRIFAQFRIVFHALPRSSLFYVAVARCASYPAALRCFSVISLRVRPVPTAVVSEAFSMTLLFKRNPNVKLHVS